MSTPHTVKLVVVENDDSSINIFHRKKDEDKLVLVTNPNGFKNVIEPIVLLTKPPGVDDFQVFIDVYNKSRDLLLEARYNVYAPDGETPEFDPATDVQFGRNKDRLYSGYTVVEDTPNAIFVNKAASIYDIPKAIRGEMLHFERVSHSNDFTPQGIQSENERLLVALEKIGADHVYLPDGYTAVFSSNNMALFYPTGKHMKDRHPALEDVWPHNMRIVQRGQAGSSVTTNRVNSALEKIGAPSYQKIKLNETSTLVGYGYADADKVSLGFAGHLSDEDLTTAVKSVQKARAMFYADKFCERLNEPNAFYYYIEFANDNEYPELVEHALLGLGAPYDDETKEKARFYADAITALHTDSPSNLTDEQYLAFFAKMEMDMKSYAEKVKPNEETPSLHQKMTF